MNATHIRRAACYATTLFIQLAAAGCRDEAQFSILPASTTLGPQAAPLLHVDLDPAPSFIADLPAVRVHADDPLYHRSKVYEGYLLGDVMRAGGLRETSGIDRQLVFVCADGYRPSFPLERALKDRAVLAARDLTVRGTDWEPFTQGRERLVPAPFYLVWDQAVTADGARRPWPYKVVAIEVWSSSDRLLPQLPASAPSEVQQGFVLFQRDCIACHSINLTGGTLGPELNVPANVTEYWSASGLRAFVRNPAALRVGSKMPRLGDLTDDNVDQLIAYLRFMKAHKVETR